MLLIRTAPGSGALGRRNIKSRCILFSLLFFISSSGLNAAPGDPTITLSTAVQRSLSQNPSLKVFPYRYAALQGQAGSLGHADVFLVHVVEGSPAPAPVVGKEDYDRLIQ